MSQRPTHGGGPAGAGSHLFRHWAGLAHVKLLVEQLQQPQRRPFGSRVGVLSGPASRHQRMHPPDSWPCLARPDPGRAGICRLRANSTRWYLPPAASSPAPATPAEPRPGLAPGARPGWPLHCLASGKPPCWPRPVTRSTAEWSPPVAGPTRQPSARPADCAVHRPARHRQNASAPPRPGH